MSKTYQLTREQRTASDPAKSIWVSANAGSGKTHVLVERVIRLLLSGAAPDSILCITYTKAAAAEMASRLFGKLSGWTALPDEDLLQVLSAMGTDVHEGGMLARARRLFTEALETPGGLKIQTIHAFCERLLHLFPVEAGLSPGFTVIDDRRAQELQEKALGQVLHDVESGVRPDLSPGLALLTEVLNKENFDALIQQFLEALRSSQADLAQLTPEVFGRALRLDLGLDAFETADAIWTKLAQIDRGAYAHAAQALAGYPKFYSRDLSAVLKSVALAEVPKDELIAFHLTDALSPRAKLLSKDMMNEQAEVAAFLTGEQERIAGLVEQAHTFEIIDASCFGFALAKAILTEIDIEKSSRGEVDFSDLIARTAQLLSTRRATQWVLYKLDSGLSHILLDEAQDTGPQQWRMIKALAEEFFAGASTPRKNPRTLFVVGDQKQSIYSFQGADARAYASVRHGFVVVEKQLENVDLTTSYRSTDEVLQAVDKVFDPAVLNQAGVVASSEIRHKAFRAAAPGLVELWPLFEHDEKEDHEPWTVPVDRPPQHSPDRRLAQMIAQKVKSWLSPLAPRMIAGTGKPVTPDDILILFRSRSRLFRMVLSELRYAGVPVLGADRLKLGETLIVQDLLAVVQWLHLPQDDHALTVVLKSPLVPEPVSEAELFELCYGRGEASVFSRLQGANKDWLLHLVELSGQLSPYVFLTLICEPYRKAISARLGSEAIEAIDGFLDLALQFEREQVASLAAFVNWFSASETTLKREMEKGGGAVRIMTVHGSKGLEAPIVILADIVKKSGTLAGKPSVFTVPEGFVTSGLPLWLISGAKPFLPQLQAWDTQDATKADAEALRLLYVAMTRAGDELYLTGIKGKRESAGSWWDFVTAALGTPVGDKPLRHGVEDRFMAGAEATSATTQAVLPAWVLKNATIDVSVAPRKNGKVVYGSSATEHGLLVHKLLDDVLSIVPDQRALFARKRAIELGIAASEADGLVEALALVDLQPFIGPESRGEVEIVGILPSGERVDRRVDRIAIGKDTIHLLDFKTDRAPPPSLPIDHPYAQQMAAYIYLLGQAYPSHKITAALFWTERLRLEVLSPTMLITALQREFVAEA